MRFVGVLEVALPVLVAMAVATLRDLADANPSMPRAYRRAAETVRSTAVPVAELVRSGRVRELRGLRGLGPGIEGRLRELVETGRIAELAELEREFVGLGRNLGLGAARVTRYSAEASRSRSMARRRDSALARCRLGWNGRRSHRRRTSSMRGPRIGRSGASDPISRTPTPRRGRG